MQRMRRMLIADDEKQICEGLRKILNWNEYGIEICGTAGNGLEALDFIKDKQPDIVLMDIKMPEMDGIEVLKKVKEYQLKSKIVVLSGFNDYSYIRQAMKFGALDYLLKPAGKDELIQMIDEVMDQLTEPVSDTAVQLENRNLARDYFLSRLLIHSVSAIEYREKTELLDIDLEAECLLVVKLSYPDCSEQNPHAFAERDRLLDTGKSYAQQENGYILFSAFGEMTVILKGDNDKELIEKTKADLGHLLDRARDRLNMDLYASLSRPVSSYRGLAQASLEAEEALRYRFVFEGRHVLPYGEIQDYLENDPVNIELENKKIREWLLSKEEAAAGAVPECIGKDFYAERKLCVEAVIYAYELLMDKKMADRERLDSERSGRLRQLSEKETSEEMKEYADKILYDVRRQYREQDEKKYSNMTSAMLQRVRDNYGDVNLSLQYMADLLDVNPAYLGRVFKKETGISFVDYLNSFRVYQAERLIRETNIKGSELCERVGYSNYNYFYIVFKKITGHRPMELRKGRIDSAMQV